MKFANVWGVYVMSSGTILASDINSGLWIVKMLPRESPPLHP